MIKVLAWRNLYLYILLFLSNKSILIYLHFHHFSIGFFSFYLFMIFIFYFIIYFFNSANIEWWKDFNLIIQRIFYLKFFHFLILKGDLIVIFRIIFIIFLKYIKFWFSFLIFFINNELNFFEYLYKWVKLFFSYFIKTIIGKI